MSEVMGEDFGSPLCTVYGVCQEYPVAYSDVVMNCGGRKSFVEANWVETTDGLWDMRNFHFLLSPR